jgi:sigma-B regulation protein RsbU (phosphoserine phosphatase)
VLGEYLHLFAAVEIFIFIFMEIVSKIESIQRVIFKKAQLTDYVVFILLFGLFSIFGTYTGIPESHGALSDIRNLAPIVAGLVAGPYAGLAVGLIGGIHRLFLGGPTYLSGCLSTVLAGLLAGAAYRLNRGKLLGVIPAMVFTVGYEFLHAGVILLVVHLVSPFTDAVEIVRNIMPGTIIAVSLGVGISFVVLHNVIRLEELSSCYI